MRIICNETMHDIRFKIPDEPNKANPPITVKPGQGQPVPDGYTGPVYLVIPGPGSYFVGEVEETTNVDHEDIVKLNKLRATPMDDPIDEED